MRRIGLGILPLLAAGLVAALLTAPLTAQDNDLQPRTLNAAPFPPIAVQPVPGTYVDRFDDGVVGSEYSPLGGVTLFEQGGQLHVVQSAPGEGVLVTFPDSVGGAQLWAFCVRIGLGLATQLAQPGDEIAFSLWEQPSTTMTALRAGRVPAQGGQPNVRWEIDKVNDTTYNYRIYKNGELVKRGRARINEDATGFRIDKVPGTNKVIGEVLFEGGRWEKLWEKDPPEIPYESFSVTSNMDGFALDEVMAGLHTDDPNTEGAIGDLTIVPFEQGGLSFTPLGADLYDVEVTIEDLATFGSAGEATIPVELQIGSAETSRSVAFEVKCRGTGTGTCSGQSSCSTKTCPDREYDIGDGNGYQAYSGTCKKATIGLPLCSCSYSLKKNLAGVEIFPGETVTAVVDPGNVVPEFLEGDNAVSATPSLEATTAVQSFACRQDDDGLVSLQANVQITTGLADLTLTDPASVQMLVSGPNGIASQALAAQSFVADGRSIHAGFVADASNGLTECPTELVILGSTTGPIRFWSSVTPAGTTTDADYAAIVQGLLRQLEDEMLPLDTEVATPILVPTVTTGQLIALGDLAVPELIDALTTATLAQQGWAALALGEIGNDSALPALESRNAAIVWDSVDVELELTVLRETFVAIGKLQDEDTTVAGGDDGGDDDGTTSDTEEQDPEEPEEEETKRCCVEDVDAVSSGPLAGGRSVGDYRAPGLTRPDGGGVGGRWPAPGTQAGEFNEPGPGGSQRTGAVVQIVGTLDGDRSCCTITQHFTIEESNYDMDTADVGEEVDDLATAEARIGDPGAAQRPPFRQPIGTNQDSFVDYTSRQYNAPPGRLNYTRKQRFTSCYHSYEDSDPPCEWDKCCVTWLIMQTAMAPNGQTMVTVIGSDCDSGP